LNTVRIGPQWAQAKKSKTGRVSAMGIWQIDLPFTTCSHNEISTFPQQRSLDNAVVGSAYATKNEKQTFNLT
jgi:hypothetical protein